MKQHMHKVLRLLPIALLMGWQQGGPGWSDAELQLADTAREVNYLTAEEKEVIKLVNLVRMDGLRYLQTFYQDYRQMPVDEMKNSDNEYIRSLYYDLQQVKGRPVLLPDKKLYRAAAYHARDMGQSGRIGHTSTNGQDMADRLTGYIKRWQRITENCSYGYRQPAKIVGQLLLDEDVPSLGHRKNILDPQVTHIGVAIAPHAKYQFNCVMDFCAYPDR